MQNIVSAKLIETEEIDTNFVVVVGVPWNSTETDVWPPEISAIWSMN